MTTTPDKPPPQDGAKEIDTDAWEYLHACPRCQFPFDCSVVKGRKKRPRTAQEPSE